MFKLRHQNVQNAKTMAYNFRRCAVTVSTDTQNKDSTWNLKRNKFGSRSSFAARHHFASRPRSSRTTKSVLPPAHRDEDVDGRRGQHDPDGDHDVVERNVVDVVQLQAEHYLRGQLEDSADEIPAKYAILILLQHSKTLRRPRAMVWWIMLVCSTIREDLGSILTTSNAFSPLGHVIDGTFLCLIQSHSIFGPTRIKRKV